MIHNNPGIYYCDPAAKALWESYVLPASVGCVAYIVVFISLNRLFDKMFGNKFAYSGPGSFITALISFSSAILTIKILVP